MTKRKYRTREERINDAKEELVRLEQSAIDQAVRLHEQARGWALRAKELLEKAGGADTRADDLLMSVGIEPIEFWEAFVNESTIEEKVD